MSDVTDVRVLITGSTSGLGLAMAEALVAGGARVVITGRDQERLGAGLARLSSGPGRAHGVTMDVRDEASVRRGVDAAHQQLGGLDVLVNNAGLGMRHVNPRFLVEPRPFWDVSVQGFRDVVDTNLTGYFLVSKIVAPGFVEQGKGKIINITMNHETMQRKGFVPYGPSRAGTEALSTIMAADLVDHGVTVNQLLPGGATATGMIPEDLPAEARAGLLDPSVMADPIRWLCSADSDGSTGLRIDASRFADWLRQHARG